MVGSTRRLPRTRNIAALGLVLLFVPAGTASAQAPTWGTVQPEPVPTPPQGLFGSRPLFSANAQPKPLYIQGYGGTAYPPLLSRRTAMRPNYGRPGLRQWFAKLRQGR